MRLQRIVHIQDRRELTPHQHGDLRFIQIKDKIILVQETSLRHLEIKMFHRISVKLPAVGKVAQHPSVSQRRGIGFSCQKLFRTLEPVLDIVIIYRQRYTPVAESHIVQIRVCINLPYRLRQISGIIRIGTLRLNVRLVILICYTDRQAVIRVIPGNRVKSSRICRHLQKVSGEHGPLPEENGELHSQDQVHKYSFSQIVC